MAKDLIEETGEYTYTRKTKKTPVDTVIGKVKVKMPRSESGPQDRVSDAIQGAVALIDEVLKARGELSPELRNRLSSWRAFAMSVTKPG